MFFPYSQQRASETDPVKGQASEAFCCTQDDPCTHAEYIVLSCYDLSFRLQLQPWEPSQYWQTRPFKTRESGRSTALQ